MGSSDAVVETEHVATGAELPTQATPPPETTAPPDSASSDTPVVPSENPLPPSAYNPNFDWSVQDKKAQFDDWIRPVIKNKEIEDKVRDLYTKAYGLEVQKPKFEQATQERDTVKEAYSKLYNDVYEAMNYRNQGDLDTFFEKLGLKEQDVAKWMLDKLQRDQLPPEQKQQYDELRSAKRQSFEQSRIINEVEGRYRNIATQARSAEIDSVLARPDVNAVVERFDAKNGSGAFKQQVARFGKLHFDTTGEDPPAAAVVSELLKWGEGFGGGNTIETSAAAAGDRKLPVIPNVSGKNVSPTRPKPPKSTDDLRKLAAEAAAAS